MRLFGKDISSVLVIGVVAVLVVASAGVYFMLKDEKADITIAWADKDCYEPFWIAQKMGFWEAEGVKVNGKIVANGAEVASAILSGNADIGGMGADPLLRMLRDDPGASIITRYQAGSSHSEFVTKDGANGGKITIAGYNTAKSGGEAALKAYLYNAVLGAKVGMQVGTAYWSWFLGFLENIGIDLETQLTMGSISTVDPNKVIIVPLNFNIQVAALERGEMDIISGGSPNTELALGLGPQYFMIEDPDAKMTTICLMASGQAQAEKGDAITKVLRGLQRACDYIYSNPEDAARIIEEVYGRNWSVAMQTSAFNKSIWGLDIVDTDVNPNADVGALKKAAELINAAGQETGGKLPTEISDRINREFMVAAGLPTDGFIARQKLPEWGILPA